MRHYRYPTINGVQKFKTKTTIALTAFGTTASSLGLVLAMVGNANAVTPSVIYNSLPSPQPGNVVSEAFEATSTSEFGGQVSFAGSARQNPTVTVLMSSWGCQTGSWFADNCTTTPGSSFSEPITLNVYNVGAANAVGSLVGTSTQTFSIPFRPSADPVHCTGAQAGEWFDASANSCFNGFATPVSFTLTGVTLPNNAIVTVAYNTSDFGAVPYGDSTACHATSSGCGYDSLNVGLVNTAPAVGTNPVANSDYLNSSFSGSYCDNGVGGVGALRFDNGTPGPNGPNDACPYTPAISVTASPVLPTTKDQCMKDGWETYGVFKNQGDCVSFVATGGKNQP